MRSPNRRRPLPNKLAEELDWEKIEAIIPKVRYVGSVEHKDIPNPLISAEMPRPRPDASICPRDIKSPIQVNKWLKEAFKKGAVSDFFEGDFPRYVWYKKGNQTFMGRLVNRMSGEYKGFPIEDFESPTGLDEKYEK